MTRRTLADREFMLTNPVGGFVRMPLDLRRRRSDQAMFAVSQVSSGDCFLLLEELRDRLVLLDENGAVSRCDAFGDPLIVNRYGAISFGYHVGGNADRGEGKPKPRYSNAGRQFCMPRDLPGGISALAVKYMINNQREGRWLEVEPVLGFRAVTVEQHGTLLVVRREQCSDGIVIGSNFARVPSEPLVLRHPLAIGTNFVHMFFAAFQSEDELDEIVRRCRYEADELEDAVAAKFERELARVDRLLEEAGIARMGEGEILYPLGKASVKVVAKHPRMHGDPEDVQLTDEDPTLLRLRTQALDDMSNRALFAPCEFFADRGVDCAESRDAAITSRDAAITSRDAAVTVPDLTPRDELLRRAQSWVDRLVGR